MNPLGIACVALWLQMAHVPHSLLEDQVNRMPGKKWHGYNLLQPK